MNPAPPAPGASAACWISTTELPRHRSSAAGDRIADPADARSSSVRTVSTAPCGLAQMPAFCEDRRCARCEGRKHELLLLLAVSERFGAPARRRPTGLTVCD
jgi:hypothetical protein